MGRPHELGIRLEYKSLVPISVLSHALSFWRLAERGLSPDTIPMPTAWTSNILRKTPFVCLSKIIFFKAKSL